MIDLHSHVIPDVDDGPKTMDESLTLLAEAYAQGVRYVVATSHRRKGMFETPEARILEHFLLLSSQAKKQFPDLELLYGGELYYSDHMLAQLEKGHFPTLNGTRFVLIEFSSKTPYTVIHQAVRQVSLLGLTPLVAHIERYEALAFDEKKVHELIQLGAYTQVNSSSVLKPKLFGDNQKHLKKRARFFLDKDLVHCVASDMHNLDQRRPYMKEAYELVASAYGQARAQSLFITNPQALLDNHYI